MSVYIERDCCGKREILKEVDEKLTDGGYTRIPVYEKSSSKWDRRLGYFLCEECNRKLDEIVRMFMEGGSELMEEDHGKDASS